MKNKSSLSNSQKSIIETSIEYNFDFSNQNSNEFKEDVSNITKSFQSNELDKANEYSALHNMFTKPQEAFNNLENHTFAKQTYVKDVQDYIVDYADTQIKGQASKLQINQDELAWDKDAIKLSDNNLVFKSVKNTNLDNMSESATLRQQNQETSRVRGSDSSFVGKISKSVDNAAREQGGQHVRRLNEKKSNPDNVKASSFYR
jgi:hypothetical protein